jgi:hypothetical protein
MTWSEEGLALPQLSGTTCSQPAGSEERAHFVRGFHNALGISSGVIRNSFFASLAFLAV